MPIGLKQNVASLLAQRRLRESSHALSKTFERLSSGLRINTASDDAAGLSLAATISTDLRVGRQGLRNVNDGISYLNVAQAALNELSTIISRQREIAVQAANGIFSAQQRQAMQTEINALNEEYNRIVETASFNGQAIFSDATGTVHIQAGAGTDNTISIDLTTLNIQANEIVNVGDGTYATAPTTVNATSGSQIAVGDFNNDGRDDIISANGTTHIVSLSNGDGTFSALTLSVGSLGSDIRELFVGDFNGDGITDIGATSYLSGVRVRLGNGDGTFKLSTLLGGTSNTNYGAISADINNDGNLDIVYAGVSGGVGVAGVFLGNGNGTFKAKLETAVTGLSATYNLAVGDLNNDGKQDVVVSGVSPGDSIALLLGAGDGTFSTITTASGFRARVVLGDFNKDGKLDIASGGLSSSIGVSLGDGTGGIASSSLLTTSHTTTEGLVAADINGDGNLDIVVSADNGTTGFINAFLGNGNGSLTASPQPSSGR